MSKIHIHVKDLDTPFIATVEPGEALLIGRAPDPTGIDWSLLPPQQPLSAGKNPGSDPTRYHCTQLVVPSPRVSANHLLVLHNGPALALYDLNSRNGSWVKLEQHSPIVIAEALEVSLSLAGPPSQERRMTRPANAEWTTTEDFGSSIKRALSAWLASYDITVQCVLGGAGSEAGAFPLADGEEIAVRLLGTSSVDTTALQEMVGQYVHDQNARFMQFHRSRRKRVPMAIAIP